jgi:hypothetical protein
MKSQLDKMEILLAKEQRCRGDLQKCLRREAIDTSMADASYTSQLATLNNMTVCEANIFNDFSMDYSDTMSEVQPPQRISSTTDVSHQSLQSSARFSSPQQRLSFTRIKKPKSQFTPNLSLTSDARDRSRMEETTERIKRKILDRGWELGSI